MQGSEKQHRDFVSLDRQAFAEFGTRALWNKRRLQAPTQQDTLGARALRIEGDRRAASGGGYRAGVSCRCPRYKQRPYGS